jgi:hypothetical protein
VNPSDLSNDLDPRFISEFYLNLRILSQELYKQRSTSTPAARRMNHSPSSNSLPNESNLGEKSSQTQLLPSTAIDQPQEADDYFEPAKIHDRMRIYAQKGGFPMEFLERYEKDTKTAKKVT